MLTRWFKVGLAMTEDQVIRRLGLWAASLQPEFQGGEGDWELGSTKWTIIQSIVPMLWSPNKNSGHKSWVSFLLSIVPFVDGRGTQPEDDSGSAFGALPDFDIRHTHSLPLASSNLYPDGGHGHLWISSLLVCTEGGLGALQTCSWCLKSSLWRTVPSDCAVCSTPLQAL